MATSRPDLRGGELDLSRTGVSAMVLPTTNMPRLWEYAFLAGIGLLLPLERLGSVTSSSLVAAVPVVLVIVGGFGAALISRTPTGSRYAIPLALAVAVMLVSAIINPPKPGGISWLLDMISATIIYVACLSAFRASAGSASRAAWLLAGGASVNAVTTLVAAVSGESVFHMRFSAAGIDPNNLGVQAAIGLALLFGIRSDSTRPWLVVAKALLALPLIIALPLTGSTSALISLALVLSAGVTLAKRKLIAAATVALMLVIATVVPTLILQSDASPMDRALVRVQERNDLGGRDATWSGAWRVFDDAPILGQGPGPLRSSDRHYVEIYAHNGLLSLAGQGGILVATSWALWVSVTFTHGVRLLIASRERSQLDAARGWAFALLPVAVALSALNWEYRRVIYVIAAAVTAQLILASPKPTSSGRESDRLDLARGTT